MRLAVALTLLAAPAFADTKNCDAAWREGYLKGVADIQEQLTATHAQMQAEVERQLNAQLAQLQAQRDADLKAQIGRAQQEALKEAVRTPMPSALTGAAPQPESAPSLLIRNPQNLPPELYEALMAYAAE